jgi:thiamine-phosphate pyrophosphorylase
MSIRPLLKVLARFESRQTCALPRILVLTDAARGYDIARQRQAWPHQVCFIQRTYGKPPSPAARGEMHLATCSAKQARQAGLNGIHWPQHRLRLRCASQIGDLLETASAHNGLEIARARALGIRCILVSTVFESASPSAKRPLGPLRLAGLARAFPDCSLFALGGITDKSARTLLGTGAYGIALVSYGRL